MPENKLEKDKSFFNTDFGRVLLFVAGFFAFNYFTNSNNIAESTSLKIVEIGNQQTQTSLDVKYILRRLENLEQFTSKPRYTQEDADVMITPIRTEIYDIKSEQKARETRFKGLEEDIKELEFKLRGQ